MLSDIKDDSLKQETPAEDKWQPVLFSECHPSNAKPSNVKFSRLASLGTRDSTSDFSAVTTLDNKP
jgi:hypothetical protein